MLSPEKAFVCNDKLYKRHMFRSEELAMENLEKIIFHYHAAVGFVGTWEFVSTSGKSLEIDSKANGMNKVLSFLENELENFSINEFDKKFEDGDVVDSIDVWRSATMPLKSTLVPAATYDKRKDYR